MASRTARDGDRVWLAVLGLEPALAGKTRLAVRRWLKARGFPERIIKEWLARRAKTAHANVLTSAGRQTKIRLDRLDGKQYVLVEAPHA